MHSFVRGICEAAAARTSGPPPGILLGGRPDHLTQRCQEDDPG